jgi:peptidoglycan/xylan/chitin deacetylase (PgdA/CDA1 family)
MTLTAADVAAIGTRPALVLGGGPRFAEYALGATATVARGPCAVRVARPLWSASAVTTAAAFGARVLRLPLASYCVVEHPARGLRLATLSRADEPGAGALPAVVQLPRCIWSSLDLGSAFAHLLGEDYHAPSAGPPAALEKSSYKRAAAAAYYAAPEPLRRWVRALLYARLRRRVAAAPALHSTYPVDATGWLLLELTKTLILRAAGRLVRLERWPSPFVAAATVTHDLEPRRYAYTTGLRRLLERSRPRVPRPAFGLVAEPSRTHLDSGAVARLRPFDVICHGLTHRDEPVRGRQAIATQVRAARAALERQLGRSVEGYRSPRLDRSPDLAWALDHEGFRYDSSYPDVDRENLNHFGGGVRFNLPYRPLLEDPAGLRPSRCLELPLTAPDCIQPLFAGGSEAELRDAVAVKTAFLRRTGGLYCALVHAGVFGDRDAERRERQLEFLLGHMRHHDVWLASVSEIVEWWCRREALHVAVQGDTAVVTNGGTETVSGVRIAAEDRHATCWQAVPALAPGESAFLRVPPHALARWERVEHA